jgi:hypothetical protein
MSAGDDSHNSEKHFYKPHIDAREDAVAVS